MAKKKKIDYFDMFEQQVAVANREADILVDAVENFTTAEALHDILIKAHEIEHEGDVLSHDILHSVAVDFITPIDREDIISLTAALDNVTDSIEDVLRDFYMYDIHFMHDDAKEIAHLIKKSTKALTNAMVDFRNFKKSKKFKELIIKVSDYEDQGDRLYMEAIRRLYTGETDDAVRVDVWTRIFDCMEAACDSCEHAADAMGDIMLKNS